MKKIYKVLSFVLATSILVASPLATFLIMGKLQDPVYQNTYFGALSDKFESLRKDEGKKIILIGGSNVAFGFNSELLEQEFPDYSVHNFGLYAALGTKVMMDLAKVNINKDDLVFIIPEINEQSYSLYFSGDSMLKSLDSNWDMYNYLDDTNKKNVNSAYFNFVIEKTKYDAPIKQEGVYQRINFNKYGDIEYLERDENNELILDELSNPKSLRTQNKMALRYDPSMKINYDRKMINSTFTNYLNDFSNYCNSKGAKLYFSWAPVNKLALEPDDEKMLDFYWDLKYALNFDVIGNPYDYSIDAHYFYDSNFHLNDAGSVVRTYNFASDLYRDVFSEAKLPSFEIPAKPDFPVIDIEDQTDSESAKYFEYKETEQGCEIKSIKDEYINLEEIRLPEVINHKPVVGIGAYAFEKSKALKKIVVPVNYYSYFVNGAFDNCKFLSEIYIENENPDKISVSYNGDLISKEITNLVIYVPIESLNNYKTNYNWQAYSRFLRGFYYEI